MAGDAWLDGYNGETTEELLALEDSHRIDSLVLAFEEAIQRKEGPISKEERYVLAVEGLEREVNNGGYEQFFINSSREFVDVIEEALLATGSPMTAAVTKDAIGALGLGEALTPEQAEERALSGDEALREALGACDGRYYESGEDIAGNLFVWIKSNRTRVRLGDASSR
jgi:Domain of unknown function (DUF4375)